MFFKIFRELATRADADDLWNSGIAGPEDDVGPRDWDIDNMAAIT